jgi:hypothetical protein
MTYVILFFIHKYVILKREIITMEEEMKSLRKQFQSCDMLAKIVLIGWGVFAACVSIFALFMVCIDGISRTQ